MKFRDCGSQGGKIESLVVNTTCGKENQAELKRGTSVQLSISFNSDVVSQTLESKVHGIIAGIPVPFPLKNTDGCKNCNITCPVLKNKNYTYNNVLEVKSVYPKIKVIVKWEIKDSDGDDLICLVIPVQIM